MMLVIQDWKANDLFDALCKKNKQTEVETLNLTDSSSTVEIDGIKCNTIQLIPSIFIIDDIKEIIKNKNLKSTWL